MLPKKTRNKERRKKKNPAIVKTWQKIRRK
jgi:hypothetical protein